MTDMKPDDWLHLKPYGYAPGKYLLRCWRCCLPMNGVSKNAVRCRPCAEAMHARAAALPGDAGGGR